MANGVTVSSTCLPSEIRSAVEWFLRPLPWVPEKRIAVMLSLVVRFIPSILNQARETADAQRARGVERRKNPIYRLTTLVIPMLRRILQDADNLVIAMTARCYSENRTGPEFSPDRKSWGLLIAVILLCARVVLTQ